MNTSVMRTDQEEISGQYRIDRLSLPSIFKFGYDFSSKDDIERQVITLQMKHLVYNSFAK
ncbi:hypothetical protein GBA52_028565 [Prunus armeniaca]|nr:hypothetical protein GBA52_028565 [Prunus armeniaca]